jgi:hypothetical protein
MSAPSGEKVAAVLMQPGKTPAGAAAAFYMDWRSGKPENNA